MGRAASTKQARSLRRKAPSAERYLWRLLRGRQLEDLKFRRQFPIGPYVTDFVCLRHRLIVEADGPFHEPERDAARDAWLASRGFRVLRFSVHEVESKEERVLGKILEAVGRPGLIGEI